MKIKECMCNKVEYLKGDNTIKECAVLMNNKHIGCVPICDDNGNVKGIVTDRDVILRSIACGKDVNNTKLSEIMTTNVYSCKQDETIDNAQTIMSENHVRRLPVTDERGQIVGIITLSDLSKKNGNVGQTFENICNCDIKNAE